MVAPFEPRIDGDALRGRGAVDMKAGLGAAMAALVRSRDRGLRGDVVLAAVSDEEHASVGMVAALRALERLELWPAAAVVTEPTGLDVHVAHRGFVVMEVDVEGRASHTSQPDRGANAVAHAGRILAAIAAFDAELTARDPHPRVGRGILQPGPIVGGRSWFVTPEACRLVVERRTVPGETDATVAAEVVRVLEAAGGSRASTGRGAESADAPTDERARSTVAGDAGAVGDAGDDRSAASARDGGASRFATVEGPEGIRTSARIAMSRPPFETAAHEPIVRSVARAVAARLGREARLAGAPYWMDAALIAGEGIPTVVFGPTGGGMHAADEWLHIPSLHACEDVLLDAILDVCR